MPDVAFEPVQSPLAVQLVAFVDVQVNVELPLNATFVGEALNETVGAAACWIVTVALLDAEPPAPSQVSVYVVSALSGPTLAEPLVD